MNWYENDVLWLGFADLMWPQHLAVEAEELVKESPLLRFAPGARVLDLCSGPGRFVAPLIRQGYQVTRGDRDAPEPNRPEEFDVVLNMCTSFGDFEGTAAQKLRALRGIRASLVPGGQVLMESCGREIVASNAGRTNAISTPDGTAFMRQRLLDQGTRLRTDWTLSNVKTTRSAHLETRLYSAAELCGMFEDAGFSGVECFGGFDGAAYDKDASRLIVRGFRA